MALDGLERVWEAERLEAIEAAKTLKDLMADIRVKVWNLTLILTLAIIISMQAPIRVKLNEMT